MSKLTKPLSGANLGPLGRATQESLMRGKQDQRRMAGPELAWFQQALGHRDEFPINIWHLGDSMTENYGVTDDYHAWTDLFRTAVQNRYRNGGFGYIPSKHAQGITWPYTTNPDGKNAWALTGSQTDDVDYGFGFGNRNTWLTNTSSKTITVDCDRFWIHYTEFAGAVMTIDVDAGTPFALTTTKSTAPPTNAPGLIGRVFDSQTAFGTLPLGTHTIKITSTTSTVFLDGIMVFYTDGNVGVHTWNGGHSGYTSFQFDGTQGVRAGWADLGYQPALPTGFADGVGNGTTTFTSATAAFVDLDIGSYIHFAAGASCLNGCARILSRTSGTSVTLDRVVTTATGIGFIMNRAQFTDGVTTINTKTLTSATAAFNPWDVGVYITGPTSVPAGTYIARYDSPTQVQMSVAATASQSAQTVRFMGRQARWCAPDLMTVEFGINDMHVGTIGSFKAAIRAIVSLAAERVGIGFPVGFPQRYTPSVVLLGMWAPAGTTASFSGVIATTSGQPQITSETFDFDPADAGRTIQSAGNTPVPTATTILSVQSYRQATLSNNAVATTTAAVGTILNRVDLEKFWMPFRQAMFELASENVWRFFDLYSLGGYISTNDPLNLTYDLTHPNNHGAKWVGDECDILITGQPRSGPIPVGIFDAKGESIIGAGADVAGKLAAPQDGEVNTGAPSAVLGVLSESPGIRQVIRSIVPNASAGTFTAAGVAAPTVTSGVAVSTVDLAAGVAVRIASAVNGTAATVAWPTNLTRASHIPQFGAVVSPNAATFAAVRYWIGLFASTPGGSDDPTGVLGAGFRWATVTDTTAFWRTWTNDGTTTGLSKTTTVAIASGGIYKLRIRFVGVKGTNATSVEFYINDVLVSVHTTDLPAGSALNMTPWAVVNPVGVSVQKSLDIVQMTLVT